VHYLCSLSHALPEEVSGGTTATTARLFHLELKREGVYPRAGGVYPRAGVHPLLATQFCLRFYTFYDGKDKYLIFFGDFLWGDFFEDFFGIFVLDMFLEMFLEIFLGRGTTRGATKGTTKDNRGQGSMGRGTTRGTTKGTTKDNRGQGSMGRGISLCR